MITRTGPVTFFSDNHELSTWIRDFHEAHQPRGECEHAATTDPGQLIGVVRSGLRVCIDCIAAAISGGPLGVTTCDRCGMAGPVGMVQVLSAPEDAVAFYVFLLCVGCMERESPGFQEVSGW